MIDFELSSELTLLRDTARAFAEQELRPRERELEAARDVDEALRRRFLETGLAAVDLPESLGGGDLGALARSLVLEELAAGDAGAALALDPLGPAVYPVLEFGGEQAVAERLAPLLREPGARAVLAWDPTPRLLDDGHGVAGELPWLPADRIDVLVVLEKERCYVVEGGIHCEPLRGAGLRSAGASSVRVEGGRMRASWVNTPKARRSLARVRLYAASLLIGVMRAAAEFATRYAQDRVAFGRPIAHHQGLAFLLADMATAVDASRMLVWEAACRIDRGEAGYGACADAFQEAAERAMFVTPSALQILGGHGFMQDYPVEKHMREARALGLLFGGVDTAAEDAGRELLVRSGPVELTLPER